MFKAAYEAIFLAVRNIVQSKFCFQPHKINLMRIIFSLLLCVFCNGGARAEGDGAEMRTTPPGGQNTPGPTTLTASQQKFLEFVNRSHTRIAQVRPKEISWKVDWKKQEKYCGQIQSALLSETPKWRFPLPTYSTSSPVGTQRLATLLDAHAGRCSSSSWNRFRQGNLNEDIRVRQHRGNSFDEKRWYFYQNGWVVQDIDSNQDSAYEFVSLERNGCPSTTLHDTEFNEDRAELSNTDGAGGPFFIEIGNEPVIGIYGVASHDWATDPVILENHSFLLAHGLSENVYKFFAVGSVPDPLVAQGGKPGFHGPELHPYACFIAID